MDTFDRSIVGLKINTDIRPWKEKYIISHMLHRPLPFLPHTSGQAVLIRLQALHSAEVRWIKRAGKLAFPAFGKYKIRLRDRNNLNQKTAHRAVHFPGFRLFGPLPGELDFILDFRGGRIVSVVSCLAASALPQPHDRSPGSVLSRYSSSGR